MVRIQKKDDDQLKEKILLFDLDGTLIDSTQAIWESFVLTSKDYGFSVENHYDQVERSIGMTLVDMFLQVGIPKEKIEECVKTYRGYYQQKFLEKTFLLPKVKETIERAKNSYRMGIVTSKSHFFSEKILEHFGLIKYFFTVVGIEDVCKPKPDAEPILKALEGIVYQKDQVFMIGDTMFDMQSAKNAGVKGIGVKGRYQKDLYKYTNFVFENIEDALNYIELNDLGNFCSVK